MMISKPTTQVAIVISGLILVGGVVALVIASRAMPQKSSSGQAWSGEPTEGVSWGKKARWIVPTPHRLRMVTVAGGTNSPQFEATATRYGFIAPYSTKRVMLGVTTAQLSVALGEVDLLPQKLDDSAKAREFTAGFAVGAKNGTPFRFGGMSSDTIASVGPTWITSRPLTAKVGKGEECWVRGAWFKPIGRVDVNANWVLPMNRWSGLYDRVERNVTPSARQWVTGNGKVNQNGTDAGFILFETTDPTIRCVKITGSSSGVAGMGWGMGADQDRASTQPGGFLSKEANSAQVGIEYACWKGDMQWFAIAEAGSHLFREYETTLAHRKQDPNWQVKKRQYAVRRGIESSIGFTDDVWTGFTNEYSVTVPNFSFEKDVEAWIEAFRKKIEFNRARNCRTWLILGSTQSFWRKAGKRYDASLDEKTFRDSQESVFPQISEVKFRQAILDRLDKLCKELGSAWVFDSCKVTHGLNSKGQLVWARCPSPKGGFINPIAEKDGDRGTHFSHINHQRVGEEFAKYFGEDGQTKFPPFGLLNPGEYR